MKLKKEKVNEFFIKYKLWRILIRAMKKRNFFDFEVIK